MKRAHYTSLTRLCLSRGTLYPILCICFKKLNPSVHLFCFCVVEAFFFRVWIVRVCFYPKKCVVNDMVCFYITNQTNTIYRYNLLSSWSFVIEFLLSNSFQLFYHNSFYVFFSLLLTTTAFTNSFYLNIWIRRIAYNISWLQIERPYDSHLIWYRLKYNKLTWVPFQTEFGIR